jgi:hypothetical protein
MKNMTGTKMETAAEKYRRIKAERAANEELFELETPSGMVWKLRKLNLEQFVLSGTMPMQFAAKLAKTQEAAGGDHVKAFESLDMADKLKAISFSQKVVRYCAVEPRIVEDPKETNDIGFEEVELDDFNAILTWALPGGGKAESLDSFPVE